MEVEILPPIAKSPLDSARGRGKARSYRHRGTPKNSKCSTKAERTIVVLVLQNDTTPIVERKNGK